MSRSRRAVPEAHSGLRQAGEDLSPRALEAELAGRPFRSYPAVLSTEADALAWARSGGPAGGVVVAAYQASPRGRGGIPWQLDHERDLGFSILLRPRLRSEREGWLYVVATSALADVIGGRPSIEWPDEVRRDGRRRGAAVVQVGLGSAGVDWAVVSVAIFDPRRPRPRMLAATAAAVEAALERPVVELLASYRKRCATISRNVRVRVTGVDEIEGTVTGRATAVHADGALRVETHEGRRAVVPPQHLWSIEMSG